VALTLALSTYTAAFIAENRRAGIRSSTADRWSGSSRAEPRHHVRLSSCAAMRVIVPPLTNQYLNLTRILAAVAIGYPYGPGSYSPARR